MNTGDNELSQAFVDHQRERLEAVRGHILETTAQTEAEEARHERESNT